MTIYRVAILAGVSSDTQAEEDKQSIPDQIKVCRAFIARTPGAYESAGPFIMDGYSRTGYDSLELAIREIPPLAACIQAAEHDKYDVLLLDNFDRLGDLGRNVLVRFSKYKKQIYSVRQSGALYDPSTYDPSDNDSISMDMGIQQIIQAYRIHKMRRGWKVGMPGRVQQGLPTGNPPTGYTYVNRKTPPVINDDAPVVLRVKELFLEGMPIAHISRRVGYGTSTITRWLQNPFYAGKVFIYRTRTVVPGTTLRASQPPSTWVMTQGKHKALWGQETVDAIEAEFERRSGHKARPGPHPLRGLFHCGICGAGMKHVPNKKNSARKPSLVCHKGCLTIGYDIAIDKLAERICLDLEGRRLAAPNKQTEVARLAEQIARAKARRRRVQEGYEAEPPLYTHAEASARMAEIEAEIGGLEKKKARLLEVEHLGQHFGEAVKDVPMDRLGEYIRARPPEVMNKFLLGFIKQVTVRRGSTRRDKELAIEYWF
jgi:DNA invertase Pin-like site-specific DNA recombinase